MLPGEHVIILGQPQDAIGARASGLTLRDTLLVLLPGPRELFAYLFRVPLEGTVAENVLRYGVGGLNIDECRIGTTDNLNGGAYKAGGNKALGVMNDDGWVPKDLGGQYKQPSGRWPTNLLLVHGSGCVRVGTAEYNNGKGGPSRRSPETLGKTQGGWDSLKTHREVALCYADEHGLETVSAWACQPDCPVKLLDEQSGESKSTGGPIHQSGSSWKCAYQNGIYERICDSGGASRFFPQFANFPEALKWLMKLVGRPSSV